MAQARERLAAARDLLRTDHPGTALSAAYYAMLYAARAALSEEDRYAKTHGGTWSAFSELFVKPGRIEPEHARAAESAQRQRLAGDYDAATIEPEVAERVAADAARFIDAVAAALG